MSIINYLKQLTNESLIYGISGFISRFLSIFLIPLYTRYLTPYSYGTMSLINATFSLLSIFTVFGLDSAVYRWYWDTNCKADRKKTVSSAFWFQIGVSLIIIFIIIFFGNNFIPLFISDKNAILYLQICCLTLPLSIIGTTISNWLRIQRRAISSVVFATGTILLTIFLTIFFVIIMKWNLLGIYLAQLITSLFNLFFALIIFKDWLKIRYFDRNRLKTMMTFSFPLIPAIAAYWISNSSGRYFIEFFLSTNDVGIFQIAISLSSGISLITGGFQLAWGPFILSIYKKKISKTIYARVFILFILITCFLGTALSIFSLEILYLLTTPEYFSASNITYILIFNNILLSLNYIAAVGTTIAKTNKPYGIATIIAATLTIFFNYLFIPIAGLQGAAWAILLSQIIIPIYVFKQAQKLYPIPYHFLPAICIFVISFLLSFLSTIFLQEISLYSICIKIFILLSFLPIYLFLKQKDLK